jgi:hypothetical protein
MSPPQSWREVPIPARLAKRPRDQRGYPIPYIVLVDGQGVHFEVTDPRPWLKCVRFYRCGLCGELLGPSWCFIGGPRSLANRLFTDPAMHEECARYALAVCPYLALRRGYTANVDPAYRIDPLVSPERPEKFGLGFTSRPWQYHLSREQGLLIMAGPFNKIEWFEAQP